MYSPPPRLRMVVPITLVLAVMFAMTTSYDQIGLPQNNALAGDAKHADNAMVFSTYIGGSNGDGIRDVTTDHQGNIYITGGTSSPDFPVTRGVTDDTFNGNTDVFVMKLSPQGRIIWSTYIGGPSHDRAYGIEVDDKGFIYIGGRAGVDFPVTKNAFQTQFKGGPAKGPYPAQDGFVAKLTPDGAKVIWASYFGATDNPSHPVRDIAIDRNGGIYLASSSSTGDYTPAVLNAFRKGVQPTRSGARDGVVAKVKPDGSEVLWATYIGGSGSEWGENSVRVDADANVYFMTVTDSDDAPTTAGAYDRTFNGNTDFYLAKLPSDGSRLSFGTYLGGSGEEHIETHTLAVDHEGHAYIAACTLSHDFPTTPGAFQREYAGSGGKGKGQNTNYPGDAIVAKISTDGSKLLGSTYLGGRWGESAEGVAVDTDGHVFVTGGTFSDNFPVTPNAVQTINRGAYGNAFVAKLSPNLDRLLYSSYLGGTGSDVCRAAALDHTDAFCVVGSSLSKDWPTHNAVQSANHNKDDGVLVKLKLKGSTNTNNLIR